MHKALRLQFILTVILFLVIPTAAACKSPSVTSTPEPKLPPPTISIAVEEYIERGLVLVDGGRYEEAIQEFNKAIEIDPNNPEIYFYRGNTYADKGDSDKAIDDFTKAIQLDPTNANAYYNRGISYSDKRDLDRAIADYSKTIELDPSYAFAYYNRGLAYGNKGEPDKAIADCTRAIEINPYHARSYNVRGISYSLQGKLDKAIADFRMGLELDPTLTPAGEMTLYKSSRIPLSIKYPASWVKSSDPSATFPYPLMKRHSIGPGGELTITEPTFEELGLSVMSLDEYADDVISVNKIQVPDFTLTSNDYLYISNGLKAKLIVFSTDNGQRIFYRLIYVHENSHIFNLTYSYYPLFEDTRPLINYSFATLRFVSK